MKKKDDFYVGYLDKVAPETKKLLKRFVIVSIIVLLGVATVFALTQNKDKNSAFEFNTITKITGYIMKCPILCSKYKPVKIHLRISYY